MRADEIKHDKNKKIIYYKNASLKVYDQKVFIFQNFFILIRQLKDKQDF